VSPSTRPCSTQRLTSRLPFFFCLLAFAACKPQSAQTQSKTPVLLIEENVVVSKGQEQSRLEWNQKTLIAEYHRVGRTNPRWDAAAVRALTAFARLRSQPYATSNETEFATACREAIKAGCDDPLLKYLSLRTAAEVQMEKQALSNTYCAAADELSRRGYAPVRQFYGAIRAGWAVSETLPKGGKSPTLGYYRRVAATNLIALLRDPTAPVEEAYEAFWEFRRLTGAPGALEPYFLLADKVIMQRWGDKSLAWLAHGQFYKEYAWYARGSGYADTVTKEGWKLFAGRLAVAETALEKAWQLDKTDSRAPTLMLLVAMGQAKSRPEMERWFERAMICNSNNYDACANKLLYLEPKWQGSYKEILEFGRECLESKKWGGSVPLIMVAAHDALARYIKEEKEPEYWKDSAVWADIQASFEKFFELSPDAISWRHNYAKYAYRCQQWRVLNKQISLLGPVNYDYFGGKAEYDKMVQLAKQRTSAAVPAQ
jgi:hypothetical protein